MAVLCLGILFDEHEEEGKKLVFISSLIYFCVMCAMHLFVGIRMSERIRLLLLCSFDSITNHNVVRSDALSRAFKAKINEFLKILALHINCKQTQQKMKKKKQKNEQN